MEEALEYTFANTTGNIQGTYCYGTILLEPGSSEEESDGIMSEKDYKTLRAVCEYTLKKDGTLILKITDRVPIPDSLEGLEHYTLTLTLFPEFDETPLMTESREVFGVDHDEDDPSKYSETVTTTCP